MDCRTQLASLAMDEADKRDHFIARKKLSNNILLDPNNHELYLERAICNHNLGDYQAGLDDINTAIRLKPTDCNAHYQKGLALLALDRHNDARASFKKAIEMRAKQEDSSLKDIFNLLAQSSKEMTLARGRSRHIPIQGKSVLPLPTNISEGIPVDPTQRNNTNDPVDSTTDRPTIQEPGSSSTNQKKALIVGNIINNDKGNLVITNRNIILPISNSSLGNIMTINNNRVSSSASHLNNLNLPSVNLSPDMSGVEVEASNMTTDLMNSNEHVDHSKSDNFAWNIRRSERIFLHHTTDSPGTSGVQFSPATSIVGLQSSSPSQVSVLPPRHTNNHLSVGNRILALKRPHEASLTHVYQQPVKSVRSKESTSSQGESDVVDVDDSYDNQHQSNPVPDRGGSPQLNLKRVLIIPSSSMPATNLQPSTSNSIKEPSYSSKYKRLRRDRERARRGTSKLCTIKLNDLEELHTLDPDRRVMRVIAPIDGWLYSGQLTIDNGSLDSSNPQYVVKLDGDTSRTTSYLFTQEAVLSDVIKEVKVKTVSELRKGARICCYWSRQYKCLSTGVVTSRTFEPSKSLVSVKYDNGDLSALPLEDLRLLPPDYPKYMSNCDPLLLARNGDGDHAAAIPPTDTHKQIASRIVVECSKKPEFSDSRVAPTNINNGNSIVIKNSITNGDRLNASTTEMSQAIIENTLKVIKADQTLQVQDDLAPGSNKVEKGLIEEPLAQNNQVTREENSQSNNLGDNHLRDYVINQNVPANECGFDDEDEDDENATIPPTDETIDFITSEISSKLEADEQNSQDSDDMTITTKDDITIHNELQLNINNSRSSIEENNFSAAYCPWLFEGSPKKNRRSGRTYRGHYTTIRRGSEVLRIGDSAELMPRDESILPFIAKIDSFWATARGEMRVRVRWYYRLEETEGEPYVLQDGENALFETEHFDENDVQSIYRPTKIIPWSDYSKNNLGHVNNSNDSSSKIFYLAGYYDPVRRIKHLRSDVKDALQSHS